MSKKSSDPLLWCYGPLIARGTVLSASMTIDSGWVRVFKEQVPQAFAQTCPFRPKVAYIDGMPLLMLAEGRVQHWSDFLRRHATNPPTRVMSNHQITHARILTRVRVCMQQLRPQHHQVLPLRMRGCGARIR